ncbi:MAG: hypothetical protein J7M26_00420, partial [Armatimonadetes bacterium]|nr:hypothetical protein [Armatimonadota bacterium]
MLSPVCHKLLNPEPGRPEKVETVRNFLKTMCFACPEWIPGNVALMQATWLRYGEELEKIVLEHPRLFPGYREGSFRDMKLSVRTSKGTWTDAWGVRWQNAADGLDSIPIEEEAPLRDWAALDSLQVPDPMTTDDWGGAVDFEAARENFARAKEAGRLAIGGLPHGFMFMRLFYLRGFSNFMMDVALRDARLDRLIEIVASRNERIVRAWVEAGAEFIWAGDDLGLQTALPISPDDWRRYIKPAYWRIFALCREL